MIVSKYLIDIGITGEDMPCNWHIDTEERNEYFRKQRDKHGFDERDTWSLKCTLALFLYPRLKMYDEVTDDIINKSFYKFSLRDKVYSFQECINMVLEGLRLFLIKDDFDMTENEIEKVKDAMEVLGKIWLYLWW